MELKTLSVTNKRLNALMHNVNNKICAAHGFCTILEKHDQDSVQILRRLLRDITQELDIFYTDINPKK